MKLTTKIAGLVITPALFLPALAFAQTDAPGIDRIIRIVEGLLRTAVPIVMTLAVLYFFWGLARYILAAGSEEAKAEGRRIMIGGVIALFVMVSVWGLVRWLGQVVGVNSGENIPTQGRNLIPNL